MEPDNYPHSRTILPQLFEGEELMLPGAFQKSKFEMTLGFKERFGDVAEGYNSFVFEVADPVFSLRAPKAVLPEQTREAKCFCC